MSERRTITIDDRCGVIIIPPEGEASYITPVSGEEKETITVLIRAMLRIIKDDTGTMPLESAVASVMSSDGMPEELITETLKRYAANLDREYNKLKEIRK